MSKEVSKLDFIKVCTQIGISSVIIILALGFLLITGAIPAPLYAFVGIVLGYWFK
jgi:hypothetical protein